MRASPQEPLRQFAGIRYLEPSQSLPYPVDSKGPLNSWIRQTTIDSKYSSRLKAHQMLRRLKTELNKLHQENQSLKQEVLEQLLIRPRTLFNEVGSSLRTLCRQLSQSVGQYLQTQLKRVQVQMQKRVSANNKQIQRLNNSHQLEIQQLKIHNQQLLQNIADERQSSDQLRLRINELNLLLTKSKLDCQNLSKQGERLGQLLANSQAESESRVRKLRQELNNCSAYVNTHNFDQLEMRYSDLIVEKMHLLRNNDDCHLQLHNSQLQLKDLAERAGQAEFLSLQNTQLCEQLGRQQQLVAQLNRQLLKQTQKDKNSDQSFRELQQLNNELKKNYTKNKQSLQQASLRNRELQLEITSLKDKLEKKTIESEVSLKQSRINFELKQDVSIKEIRRDFYNKQMELNSSFEKKSKQLEESILATEQLRLQIDHLKTSYSKKQEDMISLFSTKCSLQKQRNQLKLLLKQKELDLEKSKETLALQAKQLKDLAAAREADQLQADKLLKENVLLHKNIKVQQASLQQVSSRLEEKKRQIKSSQLSHQSALKSLLTQNQLAAGFELIGSKLRGLGSESRDIEKQEIYQHLQSSGVQKEELRRVFGDLLMRIVVHLKKLSDRINELQQESSRQSAKLRSAQAKSREQEAHIVQLKGQEEFLQGKIKQSQNQLERMSLSNSKEMETCRERYQGALKSIRGLQKNEAQLQDRIVQKQLMLKELNNKISFLERERESLKFEYLQVCKTLEAKSSENKLFFSLIHQLQDELQQQANMKTSLQRQNQKNTHIDKHLQTTLKECKFLQSKLQQSSIRLQEELSRNRELDRLLEEQRQRCDQQQQRLQLMEIELGRVRQRQGTSQEQYLQRLRCQYSQKLRRLTKN